MGCFTVFSSLFYMLFFCLCVKFQLEAVIVVALPSDVAFHSFAIFVAQREQRSYKYLLL
jgi:hypothetical protein